MKNRKHYPKHQKKKNPN